MALKKLAAIAAMLSLATPSLAFDPTEAAGASTMFYISIPLDLRLSRKEQQWTAGMQLQGKREYQAIRIDSMMLNAFSLNDIDAKWIIAGLVAAGAAAAIGSKDKGTTSSLQQQQTQAAASQQSGGSSGGQCQRPVSDPCKK